MEDEGDKIIPLPSTQWSWWTPVFNILSTASGVFDAIAEGFSDTALAVASHMNWEKDRKDFIREAGLEIERITKNS